MSAATGIEWTDATWNPVRGCSRVSDGCRHCYAERQAIRLAGPGRPYEGLVRSTSAGPRWTGQVRLVPEVLTEPLRWRKPRRVFVNSMSDLFHESLTWGEIIRVFAVMAETPQHTYQVLTKRPERARKFIKMTERRVWPLPNVWLGTSIEDQATADERIRELLRTPAALRFVSAEPLLGPVDLRRVQWAPITAPPSSVCPTGMSGWSLNDALHSRPADEWNPEKVGLDWVIVGGESGPGARPCHLDWIRSVVYQCREASVPVFVKQLGAQVRCRQDEPPSTMRYATIEVQPPHRGFDRLLLKHSKGGDPSEWPEGLRVRSFPEVACPAG